MLKRHIRSYVYLKYILTEDEEEVSKHVKGQIEKAEIGRTAAGCTILVRLYVYMSPVYHIILVWYFVV